jgi:hypothetical protein
MPIEFAESSWLIHLQLPPSIAARQAERRLMPSLGESTHVFIIRAWLEPREIPGASAQWRFSIQEVGEEERTYLRDFQALSEFMQMQMGMCRASASWQRKLRRLFARPADGADHGRSSGDVL